MNRFKWWQMQTVNAACILAAVTVEGWTAPGIWGLRNLPESHIAKGLLSASLVLSFLSMRASYRTVRQVRAAHRLWWAERRAYLESFSRGSR